MFQQKLEAGDAENCRMEVIFLARDLRGICYALSHNYSYSIFISWIQSKYLSMLIQCFKIYYDDAVVCSSLFRFFIEATTNRYQRLHFDVTSPNGIYLMKAICSACVVYGSRAIGHTVSTDSSDYYVKKIKLTSYSLTLLNTALNSKYTNLALFAVYNDSCLFDALLSNLNLVLSIDINFIIVSLE
ncbi:exportin-7-like [Octopus sinensis]|uniref:Exportin-7-like n=1 Tax=Octopus sinensis TaxID=2607531 RepID=A0A6P7U293_9MOLL|nr:exportin-7-like [Octopus sinensis]